MTKISRWSVAVLLVLGGLLAACSDDDGDESSSDDSATAVSTDDSLGEPLDEGAEAPTDGPVASEEVCTALQEEPSAEQVQLFPEELQEDAQDFIDQIDEYEAALEAGEEPSDLPTMSDELEAFVATC